MIEIQGTPAELYESDVNFVELIGITKTPDINEIFPVDIQQSSEILLQPSLCTQPIKNIVKKTEPNEKQSEGVPMEAISKGKVKGSLPWNYFSAGAHWSVLIVLLLSIIFVQFLASATDYFVSIWYEIFCNGFFYSC